MNWNELTQSFARNVSLVRTSTSPINLEVERNAIRHVHILVNIIYLEHLLGEKKTRNSDGATRQRRRWRKPGRQTKNMQRQAAYIAKLVSITHGMVLGIRLAWFRRITGFICRMFHIAFYRNLNVEKIYVALHFVSDAHSFLSMALVSMCMEHRSWLYAASYVA